VDRGEVIATANKEYIKMSQGDIIFHKPNEFHNLSGNGVDAANVFIVTFVSKSAAMNFFKGRHMKLPLNLKKYISLLIEEGEQNFDLKIEGLYPHGDAPIGGQQLIRIYLEQFLIMLLRSEQKTKKQKEIFTSKENLHNHIVSQIIDYLESKVYDKISISELCEYFHYGKTYLCTLFKNTTEMSIMEYYINLKIAEAKMLIREKQYNFTQVSNLLMFDNPHYFSRTFKRVTGMTPREYANSVKI